MPVKLLTTGFNVFVVLAISAVLGVAKPTNGGEYETTIKPLLSKYCLKCHGGGEEISGNLDFTKINSTTELKASFEVWETALELVTDGVMPPRDQPQPSDAEKSKFKAWYEERFVRSVQAHPGYFRPRRLSAYEYRNTLHTLLGFELEVAVREAEQTVTEKSLVMKLLPTDPPGPSGFKNDTSGNPLTTVIWDQYSYLIDNPDHVVTVHSFTQSRRLKGTT